ncbi:hypothetical protein L204_105476 [Cryptococcus depauperatus]|nr:hypothetical protein L204_02755 [Cryptococcus depauperatus CBS 7855]
MSLTFRAFETLTTRPSNPAILPISRTRSGNNKPKSLQKTKRTFKPNVTRADWPVTVLGGIQTDVQKPLQKLQGVRMQIKRMRDVEKAGGIEGLLLSRRPKDLTPFGAALRAQLFHELHVLKQQFDSTNAKELLSVGEKRNGKGERLLKGQQRDNLPLLEGE